MTAVPMGTVDALDFTYRSSRSAGLLAGLIIVLIVEMVAVHLLLHPWLPFLSWTIVVLSLASLGWLLADYRARGRRAIRVYPETVELRLGLQPPLRLPRDLIARSSAPSWRDLPAGDTMYVNLTAPAQPNVLVSLAEATVIPLGMGFKREARHLGLHVDEPTALLRALGATGPNANRP